MQKEETMPTITKGKKTASPSAASGGSNGIRLIETTRLVANPDQPRTVFGEEKDEDGCTSLQRLAQSIQAEGILQPLVVTRNGSGVYTVVCGERRLQAAKLCKLKEAPCIVREGLSRKQMLELALTENLHREDLDPVDEARALQALVEQCGYTQKELGERLGLSDAAINYKLSLLKLSPELQQDVSRGRLSATQGRVISQEVCRIDGTGAQRKQARAMQEIHHTVSAQPDSGKMDTQEVRTLARNTVDKVASGTKPCKPSIPTPSKEEKGQASSFFKALEEIRKLLTPFESMTKGGRRGRFAEVLVSTRKDADARILASVEVLKDLYPAVMQVKQR
jgi:ParB/RepB/Spo0J family partition protein